MKNTWYLPPIGSPKFSIPTPALLIDRAAMESNLECMADFFRHRSAKLRPHFKTHKSPQLALLQIEMGAIGMTCAKLSEAEVLAEAGVENILIANQVVDLRKMIRLAELARGTQIIVAVDQETNLHQIAEAAHEAGSIVGIVIEVDVGMGRCGVPPGEACLPLARLAAQLPGVHFAGLLGYEGHTVFEIDPHRRQENAFQAMTKLTGTADLLRSHGLEVEIVSAGGTGTAFLSGDFPGVTEIEAGSYPFMDVKYNQLGLPFRQALTLQATVISTPSPQRAIIDAGMKALTTDNGLPVVAGLPGVKLLRLSEEHGLLEVDPEQARFQPGDRIEIIPSHVCTTVNLHDRYIVMQDEKVQEIWTISGRGRFY
ncbi:MAG: DSD1 family PLP-dependent enzyme [Anaerolineales bacterium]|nr:DSD1 family PLP-dependent enzyme [Anaerolineales bacterium]